MLSGLRESCWNSWCATLSCLQETLSSMAPQVSWSLNQGRGRCWWHWWQGPMESLRYKLSTTSRVTKQSSPLWHFFFFASYITSLLMYSIKEYYKLPLLNENYLRLCGHLFVCARFVRAAGRDLRRGIKQPQHPAQSPWRPQGGQHHGAEKRRPLRSRGVHPIRTVGGHQRERRGGDTPGYFEAATIHEIMILWRAKWFFFCHDKWLQLQQMTEN